LITVLEFSSFCTSGWSSANALVCQPGGYLEQGSKKWWMLFTARRANVEETTGVKWVHGTRIGIAESIDGNTWTYKNTANIGCRPNEGYTFWAPDVIAHNGTFHMYFTLFATATNL
jgi:hypothetical protein